MDDDDVIEEHESFGVIGWSRQHTVGGNLEGANLFGSDLRHNNLISLTIRQASRRRSLSRSWIHGGEIICEVILSPHQFSEFLTSPNQGDGIPCTVKHTQAHRNIKYPSHKTEGELHREEFRESVNKFRELSRDIVGKMEAMSEGGAIKKGDFKELMKMVDHIMMHYESNLPFVHDSFQKAMANTIAAGKQEIEAYINKRINDAGVAALGFEGPQLIEHETEAERADREYFEANPEDE